MAKEWLQLDFEFDGLCFVIVSQEPEYRLCWGLNRELGLDLKRVQDIDALLDNKTIHEFPTFEQYEEKDFRFWRLVSIKDRGRVLIKEYSSFDYLLVLQAETNTRVAELLLEALRKSKFIQMAYLIDPKTLRGKYEYLLMQS